VGHALEVMSLRRRIDNKAPAEHAAAHAPAAPCDDSADHHNHRLVTSPFIAFVTFCKKIFCKRQVKPAPGMRKKMVSLVQGDRPFVIGIDLKIKRAPAQFFCDANNPF
jgi:hypothetical protein